MRVPRGPRDGVWPMAWVWPYASTGNGAAPGASEHLAGPAFGSGLQPQGRGQAPNAWSRAREAGQWPLAPSSACVSEGVLGLVVGGGWGGPRRRPMGSRIFAGQPRWGYSTVSGRQERAAHGTWCASLRRALISRVTRLCWRGGQGARGQPSYGIVLSRVCTWRDAIPVCVCVCAAAGAGGDIVFAFIRRRDDVHPATRAFLSGRPHVTRVQRDRVSVVCVCAVRCVV